jgi:SAM-dependent methyltransferase
LQGSVLDAEFIRSLGRFDLVYSWGVLHHTGALWQAMDNAALAVKEGGILLIALYNDQGFLSKFWKVVKWIFCSSWLGRFAVKAVFYPVFFAFSIFKDFKNREMPMSHIRNYYRNRGMSIVHDWDDWLGGYPFEVASQTAVIKWGSEDGMTILNKRITTGLGCSEFVFRRIK